MPGVFSGVLSDAFWPLRTSRWLSAIDFVACEHMEIVPGLAASPEKRWFDDTSHDEMSFDTRGESGVWSLRSAASVAVGE